MLIDGAGFSGRVLPDVYNSIRGGAKNIINYNFDDLLEWYLIHHGFVVNCISKPIFPF